MRENANMGNFGCRIFGDEALLGAGRSESKRRLNSAAADENES